MNRYIAYIPKNKINEIYIFSIDAKNEKIDLIMTNEVIKYLIEDYENYEVNIIEKTPM